MLMILGLLVGLGFTFNIVLKMITEGIIAVIKWLTQFIEDNS